MEHSALHALLLTGLIAALGGPLAMCWIILPSGRSLASGPEQNRLLADLGASVAKWVFIGALVAALASVLDLFVEVAELQGETVFGGADPGLVARFAVHTGVGCLALARIGLLLLTAIAARMVWRGSKEAASAPAYSRWLPVAALALGVVVVTSFVSHAAAQPENRPLALAIQITHLVAVASWIGILLHLFLARRLLLDSPSPTQTALVAGIVRRFSPIALATTSLLALTGVVAAWRFLGSTGALFTSAYGLTLLVKLGVLAPALAAGWVNFRRVRPELLRNGGDRSRPLALFGRMLELEVTAGIFVVAVAGILASIAPPGTDGSLQLTSAQTRAALTPDLPTTHIENWTAPEDPRGPTLDDLRYSEFTHNWAGVFVTLLGIGWLAQGTAGRASLWAARTYPFLLVPFGIAISVLANPELWIMRSVSPWSAFTNPSLLEHQLAAVLIFVLAWLSWRDQRNPERLRPLGYPLPLIMISGSLLLLGHAHSDPAIPGDIANLINVQHTAFGAFGLFAGASRWFVLRGVIPKRTGNFLWPAGVIGLGLYMAFFYREVV